MTRSRLLGGAAPDLTAAQLAAALGWVIAQAVAFGWISSPPDQALVSAGATILAAAWKLADAYLRGQRARARAADATAPPLHASVSGVVTAVDRPPEAAR